MRDEPTITFLAAARLFGVTPQTISGRVRAGKLGPIVLDDKRAYRRLPLSVVESVLGRRVTLAEWTSAWKGHAGRTPNFPGERRP